MLNMKEKAHQVSPQMLALAHQLAGHAAAAQSVAKRLTGHLSHGSESAAEEKAESPAVQKAEGAAGERAEYSSNKKSNPFAKKSNPFSKGKY